MKNVFRFLLLVSLVALSGMNPLLAQWVQTNGPYGGSVMTFAVSGTNLFAGTLGGGVFLSTNNGTSWTAVNSGLTSTGVWSLAVSGTNLFAATGGGVFLSTNNGTSWTAVNSGLTHPDVWSLAVSGTNLFAGTSGGGVFLSTNNGTSWTAVNSGLTHPGVFCLAASGTNLFAGTLGGGVFLSTNNGTSWTAVSSGLTSTNIRALAVSGTNLFAGTYEGGTYLSTNNGSSWISVNNGLPNSNVVSLSATDAALFAGTDGDGVFLSTNQGTSWISVNRGLTSNVVRSILVYSSFVFAGADDSTLWKRPLAELFTPVAPTLISPSSGAIGVPSNPALSWNSSTGATSYRLQVSTNSSFSSLVYDQSGITSTSQQVSGLANNTLYYWRVSATNDGGTSSYSSTWNFTTIVATPAAPTLASPPNGATGISTSPTLSWSASTGATSYRLQVSTSSTFSTNVFDQSSITDTSQQVPGLGNNTLYYWRVNATNAGGTSSYSSTSSFTTIVAAPAAPTLASPSDGATGVSTSSTLSWNASSGATSYGLQVSTNSNFTSLVLDASLITSTSYPVSSLANNTLFYWRVNATNAGGTSEWSTAWNFTTIATAPAVPTPLLPSNGATGVSTSTTLGWNASTGATSYRLQVSTDSSFSSLVYDLIGITGTSQQVSGLANNTLYYWRVNATNAGGTSSYSTTWNFTTIAAAPAAPTLAAPSNGATGVPTNPTLMWNTAYQAISYRLQLSTSSTFSTVVFDQSGITGTWYSLSAPLANGTLFYWRVNATNIGGTSAWSDIWSFTTIGPTSVEQLSFDIPVTYHLKQNYPNPFNPTTTIEFSIPERSFTVLAIYNALGMPIEMLVNQDLPAGRYRTRWTPRDIPSGVYFYQLRSCEFNESKKLLLLR